MRHLNKDDKWRMFRKILCTTVLTPLDAREGRFISTTAAFAGFGSEVRGILGESDISSGVQNGNSVAKAHLRSMMGGPCLRGHQYNMRIHVNFLSTGGQKNTQAEKCLRDARPFISRLITPMAP